MSQKPLTMEQLKQVLQLKKDGIAIREIARRTGISRNAEQHPDGYTYSRYCYHFSMFLKHADVSMHLEYQAGRIKKTGILAS